MATFIQGWLRLNYIKHNEMHMGKLMKQLALFSSGKSFKFMIAGMVLLVFCAKAEAQGDLLISPLRVIFEGSKKSQEINLANVGKDTATYAISVQDIRMNDDGSFEQITMPDQGQNFAGPYLRFFPRKVTLAPNEAQVVKIQLIKTNELKPGEYRSHLYFRAVPDEKPLDDKPSKKDSGSISIALKPIFGITIPTIIRIGDYDGNATLSDAVLDRSGATPTVSFTFNRTGSMSVYGELTVNYVTTGGKSTQIKIVKGIGVYTPNKIRRFKVELNGDNSPVDFHKGTLHLNYAMQMSDKSIKNVELDLPLK